MTETVAYSVDGHGTPSMDDARAVADALAGDIVGARRVLLFGSVADGTQGEGSDIDLVAVFDDLGDYGSRYDMERAARAAAGAVCGQRCDIMVTDRAEWGVRSCLPVTAEHSISKRCVVLVDLPPLVKIDYSKKIGHPSNSEEECIHGAFVASAVMGKLNSKLGAVARIGKTQDWPDESIFDAMSWDVHMAESLMIRAQPALSCIFAAYVKGIAEMPYDKGGGVGRFEWTFGQLSSTHRDLLEPAMSVPIKMVDDWEVTQWADVPREIKRSTTVSDAVQMSMSAARMSVIAADVMTAHFGPHRIFEDLERRAGAVLQNTACPYIADRSLS